MTFTLEEYELKNLLIEAVEIGIEKFLKMPKKDEISARKAYELYGSHLDRWVNNNFVSSIRTGDAKNSKKVFSYFELSKIAKREGVKERNRRKSKSNNNK